MNDGAPSAVLQSDPPTHSSPSTTAPTVKGATVVLPLTPHVNDKPSIVLSGFLQWNDTIQLQDHHVKTFLTLRKDLKEATRVLENLRAKAHTHAPRITLPKQIELRIVHNVKLPTVTGLPEFFKPEMDQLREFEAKANKEIFTIVENARQRHVAHLTHLASPNTFISSTMKDLSQFVNRYADTIDQTLDARGDSAQAPMDVSASQLPSTSPPPRCFPRDQALARLRMTLEEEVDKILTRQAQEELAASAARTAARQEDLAAQEQIQAGAHTGENIAMIATKAAQKIVYAELKAIQSKTDKMKDDSVTDLGTPPDSHSSQSKDRLKQKSQAHPPDHIRHSTSGQPQPTSSTAFQLHPLFFSSSSRDPTSGRTRPKRRAPSSDQVDDAMDDDNHAMDDTDNIMHASAAIDSKAFRRTAQPTESPSFNRGGAPLNTRTSQPQHKTSDRHQGKGSHTSRRH